MRRRGVVALTAVVVLAAAPSAYGEHLAELPGGCAPVDRAGTDGPDELIGTVERNRLVGFGGDDHIVGGPGADCLSGGGGDDRLELGAGDDVGYGRGGDDAISGGEGDDVLIAGLGADRLDGGPGNDELRDENGDRSPDVFVGGEGNDLLMSRGGSDTLDGGPGDDRIDAADGSRQTIHCGDGADAARIDSTDFADGCEAVQRVRPAVPTVRPAHGSVRRTFTVRWTGRYDVRDECNDVAATEGCDPHGAVFVDRTAAPHDGRTCDVRSWRAAQVTGASIVRLAWRGRQRPCAGRYRWRMTYVKLAAGADCERLSDRPAPHPGEPDAYDRPAWNACRPQEIIGDIVLLISRRGRLSLSGAY